MILSLIAAVSEDNAIGIDNKLPWHLPADLKFFKQTTMGKPMLMGRKTFESLGRPLPGRLNIVVSGNIAYHAPAGVLVFTDIHQAIERMQQELVNEGCIIGGEKIFEITLPLADRMYITRVHASIPGAHAFFPHIDHSQWKLEWQEQHSADEQHKFDFTFQRYDRLAM